MPASRLGVAEVLNASHFKGPYDSHNAAYSGFEDCNLGTGRHGQFQLSYYDPSQYSMQAEPPDITQISCAQWNELEHNSSKCYPQQPTILDNTIVLYGYNSRDACSAPVSALAPTSDLSVNHNNPNCLLPRDSTMSTQPSPGDTALSSDIASSPDPLRSSPRRFQCWHGCGKSFIRKSDAERHTRIHDPPNLFCPI